MIFMTLIYFLYKKMFIIFAKISLLTIVPDNYFS